MGAQVIALAIDLAVGVAVGVAVGAAVGRADGANVGSHNCRLAASASPHSVMALCDNFAAMRCADRLSCFSFASFDATSATRRASAASCSLASKSS